MECCSDNGFYGEQCQLQCFVTATVPSVLLNCSAAYSWLQGFVFAGQLSIIFILVEDYLMRMLWAVFVAAAAGRRCARAK
jgi:hypothetical protein